MLLYLSTVCYFCILLNTADHTPALTAQDATVACIYCAVCSGFHATVTLGYFCPTCWLHLCGITMCCIAMHWCGRRYICQALNFVHIAFVQCCIGLDQCMLLHCIVLLMPWCCIGVVCILLVLHWRGLLLPCANVALC